MKINLNIDTILQGIAPWDFTVTAGGKSYATRRPTIGELGILMTAGNKSVGEILGIIELLFVEKPDIRWELPVVTAFLNGYLSYFNIHTKKKNPEQEAKDAAGAASRQVQSQDTDLSGNSADA